MFAVEEEWNDEEEAKALTKAVIGSNKQPDSNVKFGKRSSLIRTLQALGSVPDWSNDAPQVGSDSETENVPAVHTKRKKKRSKKRKRGAATGEKAEDTVDDTVDDTVELGGEEEQTLTVAKKPKKKPIHLGFTKMKNTQFQKAGGKEDSEAVMEEGKTGVNTVKLNRKQWKNKMKNKRTCKNKFVENGNQRQKVKKPDSALQQNPEEVVSDLNSNSPKVVQSQTQTKTNKLQKEDGGKAQKRKKVQEGKESSTSTVDTETVQNKKFTEVQKKTKGGNQVQTGSLKASGKELPKPEVERSQEEMREEKHPEPSKRRKQESQVQGRKMEKLRRMLHGSDKKENPAEQQEEEGTHTKEVPEDRSAALRSRMEQRLESARFRYINEVLYTTSSGEAKRMFIQDPQAFGIYHRGFTAQVQRWPANPVDAIIAYIHHKPASLVVADFGCGDCKIAQSVKNKVHSFDLAPICKLVTVCDMANVPLGDATVHIAVFCLSLMGTNLGDFLMEANRVLVMGGVLKIAEVASRFENVRSFMSALSGLGFKMVTKDEENSHFYSFEFIKTANAPDHAKAGLELRPCVYKKR